MHTIFELTGNRATSVAYCVCDAVHVREREPSAQLSSFLNPISITGDNMDTKQSVNRHSVKLGTPPKRIPLNVPIKLIPKAFVFRSTANMLNERRK